ncbi:MAG: hypothetical protein M3R45_02720 [Pseudomonadota bacterium]|nr:hypothetical protein [Pseudomonadota bacterium]
MSVKLPQRRAAITATQPPHVPPAPHVPLKKEEQEVRRRHDIPPVKHHDPEEEGVLGEADRPAPPSEKPRAL